MKKVEVSLVCLVLLVALALGVGVGLTICPKELCEDRCSCYERPRCTCDVKGRCDCCPCCPGHRGKCCK